MKTLLLSLSLLFSFGSIFAQDTTYTNKKTTTVKKTERTVKKKRGAKAAAVKTTTAQPIDSINRSTDPIRKPTAPDDQDNPRIEDVTKPE